MTTLRPRLLRDVLGEALRRLRHEQGRTLADVAGRAGVSTQYLVRMPWGQELQVFSQNTGRTRMFAVGEQVELSWRPEYAFLLDARQDAAAGAQGLDADG